MAVLTALLPLINLGLEAYNKTLDVQLKRMERDLILLAKLEAGELLTRYIEQMLRAEAIELENKEWWQERFRAFGDVFDGDAWERLREVLKGVGIELPDKPPAPA